MTRRGGTRRRAARGLLALGLAGLVWPATAAVGAEAGLTRARADALLAKLPAGDPWEKTPDGSTLAWGESHLLHALVDLYEATDDVRYLAEAARRGERLLTHRDDRRGVTDGSGHSRPAWSMASKYVVAEGTVRGADGAVAFTLRSTPTSHNNLTEVDVLPAGGGRFALKLGNAQFKRTEQFDDLSLDRGDPRFVEKIVNAPVFSRIAKAGHFSDHSNLVRVTVAAEQGSPAAGAGLPAQRFALRPIPLAYMGYLGVIYHPMLRLAEWVRARPALAEFGRIADAFVQAAEESYADASRRLWRDGPQAGEGYYLCCERGESFPYDNVGEPFNYLGRHTAAQLILHRLTGKAVYRERAEKMALLFKRRLKHDAARDLYIWNYWYEPVTTTGWTAADSPSRNLPVLAPAPIVEDSSHGVLDIALVVSAHEVGLVFDATDLRRFANTLLTHVLTPGRDGIHRRVDGGAGVYPDYLPALGGWLELSRANPDVYREIRRTIETTGTNDPKVIAAVLKWERRLAERK